MQGAGESKMGSLLHLPDGIKVGWGSLQSKKEGNSHLGKNRTPQSKKVHEGSSFKVSIWKTAPQLDQAIDEEHSLLLAHQRNHSTQIGLKSSNLTVFMVPLWEGGKNCWCQFKVCSQVFWNFMKKILSWFTYYTVFILKAHNTRSLLPYYRYFP